MNESREERAKSFDSVAELYDKARPSYPDQLAKDLFLLAEIPKDAKIIEIGCGTGQATMLFAPYGNPITCLEPGERLAAIAERKVGPFQNVQIVRSKFEDWPAPEGVVDLIISAHAFHWLEPDMAFARAAKLLKDSGGIGLFWNRPDETNAPYRQAFDDAYSRYAPDIVAPEAHGLHEHWIELKKGEIESSGLFGPVMVRQYPWSLSYDAERYLELLGTYSDHLLLPEQRRSDLFQALKEEIEKLGGSIIKKYLTVLFFAKRADSTH